MSLGLEKRNVIKQGKSFVQFLVMSFARDKWDKIVELTSCIRSTDTHKKILGDWTRMHGIGFVQTFHTFQKQLFLLTGLIVQ